MCVLMQCACGSVCDVLHSCGTLLLGADKQAVLQRAVRLQAGPSAPAQLGAPAPQLQLTGSQQ